MTERELSPASRSVVFRPLFASATPSPLYETYSTLWGFSPVVLTLVYATYSLGVLAALLLAARASDEAESSPPRTPSTLS